jgi:hypothetical protein
MVHVYLKQKFLTCFGLLFCLAGAITFQALTYPVGDVSWLLHVTQLLLQGGHYGKEFFETNPPLILYLYAPAILLQKILSISVITCFRIYVFSLAIALIIFSNALLKKIFEKSNHTIRNALLVAVAFVFLLLPTTEFGQREHLMAMLCLPYLLLTVLHARAEKRESPPPAGGRVRVGVITSTFIGLLAGVGFAIKPYFLITPFLIEIYLILKHRKIFFWMRAETIAIILVLISYLLTIIVFTPEYITKIIPLVNEFYFPALPYSLEQMFFSLPILGWILLVCCYLMGKNQQPHRDFDTIFIIAASGFLLSFILQRALWYYHWLPNLMMSTLLLVKILAGNYVSDQRATLVINNSWLRTRTYLQILIACFTLLASPWLGFSLISYKTITHSSSPTGFVNTMQAVIKKHAANGVIYFLYPFDDGPYPLVDYAPATSYSRFPGLFYLPGLYKLNAHPNAKIDPKKLAQQKQFFIDKITEDFYQHPPTLVFVDTNIWAGYYDNQKFDYLKFFSSDLRFAKLFTCYKYLTERKGFKIYKNHCAKLPRL